jgi:dienelactone hydrolase
MIPAYLLILLLTIFFFKNWTFFKGTWFRKTLSITALLSLLILVWTFPIIFPVFKLPVPTGAYKVGSRYLHIKTTRPEIITLNEDDKRELMVKVWYPAEFKGENLEDYLNDGDRVGFAVKYGLPKTTFAYLDYVKTHTYKGSSVAQGIFPVLIFSHGYYSKASGYYAILEQIASHGYIVLNINHTYESTGILLPDGEIKLYSSAYNTEHNDQKMAEMAWEAAQNYKKAKNKKEQFEGIEHALRDYFAAEITVRWSKDISLVIDRLRKWNKSSFLAGHMDSSKIGVFGHSQGGAAAGRALLDDDRIKAGINLDGAQWGSMVDSKLDKPFALVSSDWSSAHPNFNEHAYRNGSTNDFYEAKILNSGHSNFTEIPLMANLSLVNEAGDINPYKAYNITTKMVLHFFDKYLKDKTYNLLELDDKNQDFEIELKSKNE